MKPSVGRIVHFVYNGVHFAALVVRVWTDQCVNLFIFPNGSDPHPHFGLDGVATSVKYASPHLNESCTWHWPERE